MARKRTELGPNIEDRIAAGVKRGETGDQIAAAIGGAVSARTIRRRVKEIRGPVRPGGLKGAKSKARPAKAMRAGTSTAPAPTPLNATLEEIPENPTLPELKQLLARCKRALAAAEANGNLPLVAQMLRAAAGISEQIRKATPPEDDPNDAPDLVSLREEARRRWHEMIDMVADGIAAGDFAGEVERQSVEGRSAAC